MDKIKLGDVATSQTGPFGSQLHNEDYVSIGTPIVTVEHLGDIGFTKQNLPFVSDADAQRLTKYTLKEGDIVFSRVGAIDRNVYVQKKEEGWLFSGRCLRVRADTSKINPLYLSFYFKLQSFKKMMLNISVGATMDSLNTDLMNNLTLFVVDKKEQDKIAELLGSLNNKISINTEIVSELESIAKTIYDYWFLQFDFPDENGKPYKSSGGKMVWNEELKREIPEGWGFGNLFDIGSYVNGLACQNFRPNDDLHKLPVVKINEMHNGISSDTEWVRDDINEKHIIDSGDVLFSWSASLEVMVWNGGKGGLNQHIFKVIPKKYGKYYVYLQLSAYVINFVKMAEARKTTMGHITSDHLEQSRIVLPPENIVNIFEKIVTPFFENITRISEENRELTSLRDFLLPMLMNGQVGFKD